MASPLELVKYDAQTGKFIVGKEALAVLRKVKGPVGIVSVCGRARQGKSFILNQLLHQTASGFQVGPTHRPCTKGLWMWSAPVKMSASDGSDYHLVLLDTEGIDAYDQTAQYSTQIFSLAVLLSSLFVYNQMGGIDESAIDRLSLVTEMTKHIRVKAGGSEDDNLREFAPSFLWLLRDFYLKLEEDGKKITARDYLETALLPVPGSGRSVDAKNEIRQSIKSLFPDRDCFTLVRPMHDEAALVRLDTVHSEQLRPEFQKGVKDLINLIFSKALPKRIGTQLVTGPVLAGLAEAYVQAINEGAVPTIATAWQGVAESECRRAADSAEAKYMEQFDSNVACEEQNLEAENQRCLDIAKSLFDEIAVGDKRIRLAHENKFRSAVGARFTELKRRKMAEAEAAVNEMLYNANVSITGALRSGENMSQLKAHIDNFIAQYERDAAGPSKWPRLVKFLKDVYPGVMIELMRRVEEETRRKLDAAKQETDALRMALAEEKQTVAQLGQSYQSATKKIQALQEELELSAAEIGQLRASSNQHASRASIVDTQMREMCAVYEKKLQVEKDHAESRVAAADADFHARLNEAQAAVVEQRLGRESVEQELKLLTTRCQGLEGQIRMMDAGNNDWRAKYSAALDEKLAAMKAHDELQAKLIVKDVELAMAVNDRTELQGRVQQLSAEAANHEAHFRALQESLDQAWAEALAARNAAAAPEEPGSPNGNVTADEFQSPASSPASSIGRDVDGGQGDQESSGQHQSLRHILEGIHLDGLSVGKIQDALARAGFEQEVFQMQKKKGKRADWLSLLKNKAAS